MRISDWSSDVCSSDLLEPQFLRLVLEHERSPAPATVVLVADGLAPFMGAVRFEPGGHIGAERFQIAHQMLLIPGAQIKGSRQVYASVNLARHTCPYGAVASNCSPLPSLPTPPS